MATASFQVWSTLLLFSGDALLPFRTHKAETLLNESGEESILFLSTRFSRRYLVWDSVHDSCFQFYWLFGKVSAFCSWSSVDGDDGRARVHKRARGSESAVLAQYGHSPPAQSLVDACVSNKTESRQTGIFYMRLRSCARCRAILCTIGLDT